MRKTSPDDMLFSRKTQPGSAQRDTKGNERFAQEAIRIPRRSRSRVAAETGLTEHTSTVQVGGYFGLAPRWSLTSGAVILTRCRKGENVY